jgi:hypothetical protein
MLKGSGLSERSFPDATVSVNEHVASGLNERAADVFEYLFAPTQEFDRANRRCRSQHRREYPLELVPINPGDSHGPRSLELNGAHAARRITPCGRIPRSLAVPAPSGPIVVFEDTWLTPVGRIHLERAAPPLRGVPCAVQGGVVKAGVISRPDRGRTPRGRVFVLTQSASEGTPGVL